MRKPSADVGQEVTVELSALATGGTCVGTIEAPDNLKGKKAFVTGAIPGETVQAVITFSKKSFVNADTTTVLNLLHTESRLVVESSINVEGATCNI